MIKGKHFKGRRKKGEPDWDVIKKNSSKYKYKMEIVECIKLKERKYIYLGVIVAQIRVARGVLAATCRQQIAVRSKTARREMLYE